MYLCAHVGQQHAPRGPDIKPWAASNAPAYWVYCYRHIDVGAWSGVESMARVWSCAVWSYALNNTGFMARSFCLFAFALVHYRPNTVELLRCTRHIHAGEGPRKNNSERFVYILRGSRTVRRKRNESAIVKNVSLWVFSGLLGRTNRQLAASTLRHDVILSQAIYFKSFPGL